MTRLIGISRLSAAFRLCQLQRQLSQWWLGLSVGQPGQPGEGLIQGGPLSQLVPERQASQSIGTDQ